MYSNTTHPTARSCRAKSRQRAQTLTAALLLAVQPQITLAATRPEPPCLTRPELAALSVYALPSVIRGMAQRCGAVPPAAYLSQHGEALARRYDAEKTRAWPAARAALVKLAAAEPAAAALLAPIPDAQLRPLADDFLISAAALRMIPERCRAADPLTALLSHFAAADVAMTIVLATGVTTGIAAGKNRAQIGAIRICGE